MLRLYNTNTIEANEYKYVTCSQTTHKTPSVAVHHGDFVGMPIPLSAKEFISPYHHFLKKSADVLSQVTSGDASTAAMSTNRPDEYFNLTCSSYIKRTSCSYLCTKSYTSCKVWDFVRELLT